MEFLQVPLILLLAVVAPIWIVAHYITRWRAAKTLTGEDEKLIQELWESATRMEDRIRTLEKILDAEAPHWRDGAAAEADEDTATRHGFSGRRADG
ncbi:MAG: envelope stress response membrane protein PspB [Alphaproteobacteria bacterium]|jgi:phage shock protein B